MPRRLSRRHLRIVGAMLAAAAVGTGGLLFAANRHPSSAAPVARPVTTPTPRLDTAPARTAAPATPMPPPPLVPAVGDLHGTPPVGVAERFQAPSLGIDAPLLAVGLTKAGAMDAPEGPPASDHWRDGFWYRGGVDPGGDGVATIAGHVDDTLGRPAAFWRLRELRAGDIVQVLDQRSNRTIRFRVTEVVLYSLQQANSTAVLTRMFGPDAVAGRRPGSTPLDHGELNLITCQGDFINGEYDHRLVVYTRRIDG